MDSISKGLRSGDIEKDTYERLTCGDCGKQLEVKNDPDSVTKVRICPGCGEEWKQIG